MLAQKCVVIVEDNEDTCEVLRLILEACGAQVISASRVQEAIQALETNHVDLLISDIGLPGRDGYALIREVRATPAMAKLPAVALTAFTTENNKFQALAAGFDAHLAVSLLDGRGGSESYSS
jgi:CheY-like chemotaxis protein